MAELKPGQIVTISFKKGMRKEDFGATRRCTQCELFANNVMLGYEGEKMAIRRVTHRSSSSHSHYELEGDIGRWQWCEGMLTTKKPSRTAKGKAREQIRILREAKREANRKIDERIKELQAI